MTKETKKAKKDLAKLKKKQKEKKKIRYLPTSKIYYENSLIEQIYKPDTKTNLYLQYKDGEINTYSHIELDEDTWYIPINDELLQKQAKL